MIRENGMMGNLHKCIGMWDATEQRVKLFESPVYLTDLSVGVVVEVDDSYYRVYCENGNRGLRYWNVDVEVSRERRWEIEVVVI